MSNPDGPSSQNGAASQRASDSFVFDASPDANGAGENGALGEAKPEGAPTASQDVDIRQIAQAFNAQFGETIGMLVRSPKYRHYSLADLEWLVVPALASGQIVMARGKVKDRDGLTVPVALAFWASVSEEVNVKLDAQKEAGVPFRLAPSEWRSGDIPWLLDVMGPKDVVDVMIKKFVEGLERREALKFFAKSN